MEQDDALGRQRFELAYERLYDDVLAILRRHDPIGIDTSARPNEYVPETGTILPRLEHASGEPEVRRIVHEEFARWRGPQMAGPAERLGAIAREVWAATQHRLHRST